MSDDLQTRIEEAVKNPRNLGEMKDADAVGTVGSADCGDMLRMWVKFKEEGGRKVIDRATFQTFGCQTAIAVASVATELLAGKTVAEAQSMSGEELAAPLGALPPVKIHCAQLVEGALRSALSGEAPMAKPEERAATAPTLLGQLSAGQTSERRVKIVIDTNSVFLLCHPELRRQRGTSQSYRGPHKIALAKRAVSTLNFADNGLGDLAVTGRSLAVCAARDDKSRLMDDRAT